MKNLFTAAIDAVHPKQGLFLGCLTEICRVQPDRDA